MSAGALESQQRYEPFGKVRTIPNSPITISDYGYTGQRDLDLGMGDVMDYKARFYSPYINRFVQPDTIIPDPSNPQSWNRYSYVINSPIIYSDPSGHDFYCGQGTMCPDMSDYTGTLPVGDSGGGGNDDGGSEDGNLTTTLPDVRIYCGSGSWLACTQEDPTVMGADAQLAYTTKDGKLRYPMEALVKLLRGLGFNVTLFESNVDLAANGGSIASALDPNKKYINVGFSAGGPLAMAEAKANPIQVIGLILLDPTADPGTTLDYPGKQYIAYPDQGLGLSDNSVQHYIDPNEYGFNPDANPHTQLSVNDGVANDILNFIIDHVITGQ